MAFTNIISGTIGGNGNIICTNYSSKSNLQVRYDGTGDWLECSENANITGKSKCSFELKLKDGETLTTMQDMFWDCSSLTSLDLSNLDTSSVTNMQSVFNNCSSLTSLNVSNFNTSQVTTMNSMFYNCSSLISLDLSSFNTSQVTNMLTMFYECTKLTSLDLSNFDTGKVTTMNEIFLFCPVSDIGLLYATSSTINSLVTPLGTYFARNIYYTDAPLNELTVQDNITYIKYESSQATLSYTLNKLPNGVADYIDVVNKVHVQRVGKVVFDGSDDERWTYFDSDNDGLARMVEENYKSSVRDRLVICDKFVSIQNWNTGGERCYFGVNGMVFFKNIGNYATSLEYISSWKSYLTSNSITVLYELATPIYTPLTDEEIAQLPLSAYKDGYVNLSSDQLMPSFEFRMKASNRYQVDMLETGYYYLNAPIGNVKLGTANVDVQQMPCIIKVDNVGTGDSGYRLGFDGGNISILSFDKSNAILGYYYEYTGELRASDRDCAYEEYIPISTGDSILINQLYYTQANPYSVSVILYDSNKTMIERLQMYEATPQRVNTANVAYFRFSCIHDRAVTEPTTKVAEVYINPITLAKLPSYRIPTSFTQGMKCVTDFGYWEGIKESLFNRLWTTDSNWELCDDTRLSSEVKLNRIEYKNVADNNNTIVEDEFDIATGKLTKRIGKVVLDGSHDCTKESFTVDNRSFQRYIIRADTPHRNDCIGLTNYLPFSPTQDKYGVDYVRPYTPNGFWLYQKEDLSTEEVRKRLARNPITIYYELEVPEISYLALTKNDVKTATNGNSIQINIFSDYLTPQCKPSHLTYPVPSLVGNRTYTVVHNRKNITGSTKPIELNLGGTVVQLNDASSKTLVKTPSTLAHSNLIFIGGESTVDHVMVLDGDWTNKPIEYFENMMGHDTDAIITIIGNGQIDDVAEQYLW